MKNAGYVLLAVGFLVGAFFVVEQKDAVRWIPFGLAAGCMFAGLIIVHAVRSEGSAEQAHEDLEQLERSLENVITKLAAIRSEQETLDVYAVHHRLDADLAEEIADFVDVRDTLKQRFDLQTYADVMSAFALGERHVNRSWSASADGYIDEVWRCLQIAEEDMRKARTVLDAAKVRA